MTLEITDMKMPDGAVSVRVLPWSRGVIYTPGTQRLSGSLVLGCLFQFVTVTRLGDYMKGDDWSKN